MAALRERWDEALELLERSLALARTRGERAAEWRALANLIDSLQYAGEWELALARVAEFPEEALEAPQVGLNIINPLARILTSRGDVSAAREYVDDPRPAWADARTADTQMRGAHLLAHAVVLRAEGRYEDAVAAADEAFGLHRIGGNALAIVECLVEAVEAALQLGDVERAQKLLERVETVAPGEDSQSLHAHRWRLGAGIAAGGGEPEKAEQGFKRAAGAFRELALPFWLAVTLVEYGEWLVGEGRAAEAEPLFAEAREIFERLGAKPWVERVDGVSAGAGVAA